MSYAPAVTRTFRATRRALPFCFAAVWFAASAIADLVFPDAVEQSFRVGTFHRRGYLHIATAVSNTAGRVIAP